MIAEHEAQHCCNVRVIVFGIYPSKHQIDGNRAAWTISELRRVNSKAARMIGTYAVDRIEDTPKATGY